MSTTAGLKPDQALAGLHEESSLAEGEQPGASPPTAIGQAGFYT